MTDRDTKPWYRQFWPWFIIALPASAVVASLYTVSLAVRTTDSLVVTSDDGMDVVTARHLAAARSAADHGIRARVDIDLESGAIAVRLTAEDPVDWPKTLQLLLSHPAFANRDQAITLTAAMPDGEGGHVWSGHFVDIPDGRWYVVLTDGDNWRLTGSWSGAASLQLEPAGASGDGAG
jgi:hypothetical protein